MSAKEKILESYKPLIIIPVIVTILALALVATHGLNEGIDLKGGSIATVQLEKSVSSGELESLIQSGTGIEDVSVSTSGKQATVELGGAADIVKFTNSVNGTATILSYRSVGPLLSAQALNQVYWALAFAFIFMSVTVFIVFRKIVPSLAVICSAFVDIVVAVGGMSLFGIPLSMASVGALLMLIGYSVDTDILLTTRVLKDREGTVNERAAGAFKTGITMTGAAIGAMAALYVITIVFIPSAKTLSEIAAVLILGLLADLMATWLMNFGLLRWYMEGHR
jgi:preprotein translocase subunit SecF